jgi:hypothetical protein
MKKKKEQKLIAFARWDFEEKLMSEVCETSRFVESLGFQF